MTALQTIALIVGITILGILCAIGFVYAILGSASSVASAATSAAQKNKKISTSEKPNTK